MYKEVKSMLGVSKAKRREPMTKAEKFRAETKDMLTASVTGGTREEILKNIAYKESRGWVLLTEITPVRTTSNLAGVTYSAGMGLSQDEYLKKANRAPKQEVFPHILPKHTKHQTNTMF